MCAQEARFNPACSGQDIQSFLVRLLDLVASFRCLAYELETLSQEFSHHCPQIMPVQRLPRYVLLLQDLVKHTNAWHEDYKNLSDAQAQMQTLTKNVNTQKQEAEDGAKYAPAGLVLLAPLCFFLGYLCLVSREQARLFTRLLIID